MGGIRITPGRESDGWIGVLGRIGVDGNLGGGHSSEYEDRSGR